MKTEKRVRSMCGFVGCLCENPREFSETEKHQFENMNTMIFHRGQMTKDIFVMNMYNLASAV